jgi:hypothetical protein
MKINNLGKSSPEGIVCPTCASLIGTDQYFCPNCNTPLGLLSNSDPLQRIQAEGEVYRKISDAKFKPKPIVLIGTWIIFLPCFFVCAGAAIAIALAGGWGFFEFFIFWVMVLLGIFSSIMLYRVTKNYLTLPARYSHPN